MCAVQPSRSQGRSCSLGRLIGGFVLPRGGPVFFLEEIDSFCTPFPLKFHPCRCSARVSAVLLPIISSHACPGLRKLRRLAPIGFMKSSTTAFEYWLAVMAPRSG